jgi:hypothetical protein
LYLTVIGTGKIVQFIKNNEGKRECVQNDGEIVPE